MTTIRFSYLVEGIATDVTSVILSSNVIRLDTLAVVVAAPVSLGRVSAGTYTLGFVDPSPGLRYRYSLTWVADGQTFTDSFDIPGGAGEALTLAQIKEYLRLVDDGGQDALLTDLLAAAQDSIARECDLLTGDPANWPCLAKLAVKMTVAGLYANPESLRMQELFESPAIRRICNTFKSWMPA